MLSIGSMKMRDDYPYLTLFIMIVGEARDFTTKRIGYNIEMGKC